MRLRKDGAEELAGTIGPAESERTERKDEILTSTEARNLLKIGRTKLWELTRRQVIPSYRVGNSKRSSLRYKRSELLAWLDRNRA